MWLRCSARVGVLMGEVTRAAYEDVLIKRRVESKVIDLPGCPDIRAAYARQSRPFAFIESTNGVVTRIVFATADPESFHRMRNNPDSKTARLKSKSQEIFAAVRCYGLQERILDFANFLALGIFADHLYCCRTTGSAMPGTGFSCRRCCSMRVTRRLCVER
jgi:hypothetical protein